MWISISQVLGVCFNSYASVGSMWLCDKKFAIVNIISSAALWGLWKLRNELYFQNVGWRNMELLLWKIVKLAQNWSILCPPNKKEELLQFLSNLKELLRRPVMLPPGWRKIILCTARVLWRRPNRWLRQHGVRSWGRWNIFWPPDRATPPVSGVLFVGSTTWVLLVAEPVLVLFDLGCCRVWFLVMFPSWYAVNWMILSFK